MAVVVVPSASRLQLAVDVLNDTVVDADSEASLPTTATLASGPLPFIEKRLQQLVDRRRRGQVVLYNSMLLYDYTCRESGNCDVQECPGEGASPPS